MKRYDHHERYTEFAMDAGERPKRMYEYWVTGNGVFPFDMLRYDSAWPATSEDAAKLEWSFSSRYEDRHRSIKLRSYREPTGARWSSFLWSISKEEYKIASRPVHLAENIGSPDVPVNVQTLDQLDPPQE